MPSPIIGVGWNWTISLGSYFDSTAIVLVIFHLLSTDGYGYLGIWVSDSVIVEALVFSSGQKSTVYYDV